MRGILVLAGSEGAGMGGSEAFFACVGQDKREGYA